MATKKEIIAQEVARAVSAGKPVALETVDFSDPNRPKTCLEVDFPILPVNQVAAIEGNAGKPIYQMSKWWARRRSSVFRSMLIAAATKAPEDPALAAKLVWDNYYANHQKKGSFKDLKVADIFMGGGTTLVEGSRLGMQMSGNDLNPVAWFVVKQELADVDLDEVKRLLADIEAEVKPQIAPFYCCDGPNGEKGTWKHKPSSKVMGLDFDPLSIAPEERKDYAYEGPEIICTFWSKHVPCQVTGCGHRTPIMTNPVMAVKTLTVKSWEHECASCRATFDVEGADARMAPDVPLYVAPDEKPYSILDPKGRVVCPSCGYSSMVKLGKGKNKKIELALVVHPDWLSGSSGLDSKGVPFGGSAQDNDETTSAWNVHRARSMRLLEVRGTETIELTDAVTGVVKTQTVIPIWVECPETKKRFRTDEGGGTVPKKSNFACAHCGAVQDVLDSTYRTRKTAPYQAIAIQGSSPRRKEMSKPYGGRFFSPVTNTKSLDAAEREWQHRKDRDLSPFWPKEELPYGLEADFWSVRRHGYTHWYTMFNHRQLLGLSILSKAIHEGRGRYSDSAVDLVISAFQQYLRNQCMMTIWNMQRDTLEPQFAKNNFRPKAMPVENSFFGQDGRGNWTSCCEKIIETVEWARAPWELVANESLNVDGISGKSEKVYTGDKVKSDAVVISCGSSTDIEYLDDEELDLCITDPPFGDLMQYAEWSDFFYVWLRPILKEKYPNVFGGVQTPKDLEVVSNKARNPEGPDEFYRRLLTSCWSAVRRKLKAGGILAFTFHHSQDEPWIDVLESLFEAGFILEATFPVRGDETKGDGQYGSQKVEYDIVHVCRKRTEEPKPVSWGRMRREVLADVRQLQGLLENHARAGLPAADLQVIRRGKALEYFSRHYGKVFVDEGRAISVKDALVGINQLIDEDANKTTESPPVTAEPITRQFLRIFNGQTELARDQMQKLLRGSGISPDEFTNRGWATEEKKVFHLADPLAFARDWQGRHRRRLTADLDQALVLVGACYDGSGINASDTLKNENFKPHPALKSLLEWLSWHGATQPKRNASSRALTIYNNWASSHKEAVAQMSLFQEDGA
ncbi:DUF1156 domain-containing protein [Rhizobium sp. WSM1274]|uniref:DUF1156 domain-containing protein n=1 Tax=Rhizobium sp. WSM1274 TaxID=3138254 RepID=UPI0021A58458|nr:DUF1156 domain-containing protein [Rhizobium leguminosarum]UWU28848.1 DUF1156 domain-containing protein [Rhizobium leguminosarum bv. viciae]